RGGGLARPGAGPHQGGAHRAAAALEQGAPGGPLQGPGAGNVPEGRQAADREVTPDARSSTRQRRPRHAVGGAVAFRPLTRPSGDPPAGSRATTLAEAAISEDRNGCRVTTVRRGHLLLYPRP